MLKASVFDLFEDIRFTGAIRLPLLSGQGTGVSVGTGGVSAFVPVNQSLFDGGGEWYARGDYLKKRIDYSLLYYRKTEIGLVTGINNTNILYEGKMYTNLFQGIVKIPLDRVRVSVSRLVYEMIKWLSEEISSMIPLHLKQKTVISKVLLLEELNMYMIIPFRKQ